MLKSKRLVLTLPKPWLFRYAQMEDQISVLNMIHKGKTLKVCRGWYRRCVELGMLDDCDFNLIVVNNKYNPPFPEL